MKINKVNGLEQPIDPFSQFQQQAQNEQFKLYRESESRFREQVIAVFTNPHGLQLLETMEEMFIHKSVCPAGCIEGFGYYREGQNSIVQKIRMIVKQSQQPQVTQ